MPVPLTATAIRRQFATVIKRAQRGETFTVERHRKVVMAIISGKDYKEYMELKRIRDEAKEFELANVSEQEAPPLPEIEGPPIEVGPEALELQAQAEETKTEILKALEVPAEVLPEAPKVEVSDPTPFGLFVG